MARAAYTRHAPSASMSAYRRAFAEQSPAERAAIRKQIRATSAAEKKIVRGEIALAKKKLLVLERAEKKALGTRVKKRKPSTKRSYIVMKSRVGDLLIGNPSGTRIRSTGRRRKRAK